MLSIFIYPILHTIKMHVAEGIRTKIFGVDSQFLS
jgi:hypothetical protein